MTNRMKATALVTGGAKRLGRAIVEDLAANGFAVAVHCNRSREEAEALVGTIIAAGGRAAVVAADLTDLDTTAGLIDAASNALGPINLLVNNASLLRKIPSRISIGPGGIVISLCT